jgi:LCP family protein required for cell wall assembly
VQNDGIWHKVNESYAYGGAPALESAVESLLGVNVDYYALVNVDFAERVIDALGGVDVYVPRRMDYDDFAAGLHVHIPEGNQHLGGEQALGYLRIRKGYGDDYARMDRAKEIVGKLLERAKSPAAIGAIPTLLAGLTRDVETNMDLEFIRTLAGGARGLSPRFATMPTLEPGPGERARLSRLGSFLVPNEDAIRTELGSALGLEPDAPADSSPAPTEPALIVNASGSAGLARAMARLFVRSGLPEPRVVSAPVADTGTQVSRTRFASAGDAEAYARFLGVPVYVPNVAPDAPIVITLGRDAASRYAALAAEAAAEPQ